MGKPKIGIIGDRNVGSALRRGLERSGYQVRAVGEEPAQVRETGTWAEVLVLAVPYSAVDDALRELGDSVNGKTIIGVTNALTAEMPLASGCTSSGGETLQQKARGAKVVKAFNTQFAQRMDTGALDGQPVTVFAAGDDSDAKQQVMQMARDIGFDAVDAGPLQNATPGASRILEHSVGLCRWPWNGHWIEAGAPLTLLPYGASPSIGGMMRMSSRGRCRFAAAILTMTLGVNACSSGKDTVAPASSAPSVTQVQPGGLGASSEWPSYNGGYNATRFSPVTQINSGNAASLTEVARFSLPETTAFQSGPVLIDGTIYVTTAANTYAVDARTGVQRWMHHFEPKSFGIGTPVRGVGYADGRLFRGTPDGHLLALDAKTGAVVWDVVGADAAKGEYYTAAPVVWEGRVYMANSGSDVGAIGHIRAFDTQTGKQVWNFDVVPSEGPGAQSWPQDRPRVGGGVYASFAVDTDAGVLYSPTGNPGPDFVQAYRPGDNLYTSGVVMLDARTGALRGFQQLVKNDFHDWDVAASPILFTSRGGTKMVAVAGKNGYLVGFDRNLKNVVYKVAVTTIENVEAPFTKEGTRFLPGTQGGTNWYGPTYSPVTNAIYVPAIDWATTIKLGGPEHLQLKPGTPFLGSANVFGDQDPVDQRRGHVTAVDADSGKVLWKYDSDTSMVASVTPTAGGIVLTGDTKGNILVFDGADGRVLLKKNLGDPIGGGIIAYEIDGKAYIAVAGGMKNTVTQQTDSGPAWVSILSLPR